MSHHSVPSGYVKSILQNGVGRYVCQMSRVTFKFCKHRADSRGMRLLLAAGIMTMTTESSTNTCA